MYTNIFGLTFKCNKLDLQPNKGIVLLLCISIVWLYMTKKPTNIALKYPQRAIPAPQKTHVAREILFRSQMDLEAQMQSYIWLFCVS